MTATRTTESYRHMRNLLCTAFLLASPLGPVDVAVTALMTTIPLPSSSRATTTTIVSSHDLLYSKQESVPSTVVLHSVRGDGDDDGCYFASCIPGLEKALAKELVSLGATCVVRGRAGAQFSSNDGGYKTLLWLRTAHRVMQLLGTVEERMDTKDDLYRFVQVTVKPRLKSLFGNGKGGFLTLSVRAVISPSSHISKELCHSHYSALTVKNAIVDLIRDATGGDRPTVDAQNAEVPLILLLGSNAVSLYRCLHSGGSLHRRGYRNNDNDNDNVLQHKAPMKESMAAGLLLEAGWDLLLHAARYQDGLPAILVDPMTGSATLPIEAALMASDIAPGLMRPPPVALRWKDANVTLWDTLFEDASDRAKSGYRWCRQPPTPLNKYHDTTNCVIYANECNSHSIELARRYIRKAGLSDMISLRHGNCSDWKLRLVKDRTIIVTNPPWGVRLNDDDTDIEDSWRSLQTFLRDCCGNTEAWILSGNKELTRLLRMKKSRSIVVRTANEDLRWIQYHIFPPPPI